MTKKKISLCYKTLVCISLLSGIVLNLMHTKSVAALLSYYTLQSNILCLVAFSVFLFMELRHKRYKNNIYYLIKGAIIIAISITAIVYRVALAPVGFEMDSLQSAVSNKAFANLLVHTVSPILVILDYFLFDAKGKFKRYYPLIWLIIPSNYAIYVYTYSAHGGEFFNIGGSKQFAYFFLDYIKLGISGVAKWMIFILLSISAISYIFVWIDRKLARLRRARKEQNPPRA